MNKIKMLVEQLDAVDALFIENDPLNALLSSLSE
uniref:Uncharacterized protein n=1 Tax=Peronospora matthiolae TaxID=2874970 RepID=A0AAV1TAY5_9STRA